MADLETSHATLDHTGLTGVGGSGFTTAAASVATDQSLNNAGYSDLATAGPAVTVTVNTKCLVILAATTYFSNNAGTYARMGVTLSSANTIAAADTDCLETSSGDDATGNTQFSGSRTLYFSGLTPGSTVFTAKYKSAGAAGTSHWLNRRITVICLD